MYDDRRQLYTKIEEFTNSKVLCYVTGDRQNMPVQIGADAQDHFVEHLDAIGITDNISLILYSRGGNTLAGWSLVNLIKQFCKDFHAIVPSKAHSAATLIALGANSIMMTKQATLGPIDPSVNGPLNPQAPGPNPLARIPVSVESVSGYIDFAKSLEIESAGEMTRIVQHLAEKVHPLVLGNVFRSRSQIRMLGKRLMADHIEEEDKIDKILDFLCSESGSHDYTIHRREARDRLGLNITKPDDVQYEIIKELHNDYSAELELLTPYDPNMVLGQENEKEYSLTRALIESTVKGSTKFLTKGRLSRTRIPPGPMSSEPQEGVEDRRTFEGWTND